MVPPLPSHPTLFFIYEHVRKTQAASQLNFSKYNQKTKTKKLKSQFNIRYSANIMTLNQNTTKHSVSRGILVTAGISMFKLESGFQC